MAEMRAELIEYARRAAKEHLSIFVRLVWDCVNPGVPLVWNWHLDVICEHLEALSRREIHSLVIALPPGCCKSTLVGQCWPCWDWLKQPEKRWIFATNSLENARKEATYRRSIIESDVYAELLPPFKFGRGGGRVNVLRNKKNGEFRATSVGATITGAHFDYQVIDDPNNAQRIAPEDLKEVNDWYDRVLSTRVRDGAATVLIQQRLAPNDMPAHLLDLGVDASIVLPAIYDPKIAAQSRTPLCHRVDPRSTPGALLWPARKGEKVLKEQRQILGPLAFSAQYQQVPHIEGGEVFQGCWWKRHGMGEIPSDVSQWIITVDTASSQRDSADLTVVQCWCLTSSLTLWMVEQQSGHWDITEQLKRIISFCKKFPACKRVAIEERLGGFALCSLIQKELPKGCNLLRWKSTMPKVFRIEAIAPFAENGQISIPQSPEGEFFINQASEFPQGLHDDAIDCCGIAVDIWKRRMHGLPLVQTNEYGEWHEGGTSVRTGSNRLDRDLRLKPKKRLGTRD